MRPSGLRRGASKPAQLYGLTPEAAELFPRGYAPVLDRLLGALGERLPPDVIEEMLRDVGRRMALERPLPRGGIRERTVAATSVLDGLGGITQLREADGVLLIDAWGCPLAAVVPGHPELCRLVEALLAEMVGASVREQCDRREPPRCSFELAGGRDVVAGASSGSPRD